MAKERSIKDAWQAARANATNRVAVRDCLTQTPRPADQELASQEEENASNHQRDSEMVPVEDESLLNSSDTTQLLTTSASPAHGGDPENARNHQRDSVDEPLLNGTDTTQLLTTSASPAPRGDPEGDPKAPDDKNAKIAKKVAIYAAVFGATAAVIGVGAFIAVPLALAGAGFTAAGIASGSIGASMMSASAIASGGGVAAGSVVAVLQSAGAAGGIGAATCAALGIGTAAVGTALVAAVDVTVGQVRYIKRQGHRNPNVDAGTQTDDDDKKDTDTKNDDDNEKDTDKQMDTDEQTVTDKQANADAPTEE